MSNATEDLGVTVYGPGDVLPDGKLIGVPEPDGLGGFVAALHAKGKFFVSIAQADRAKQYGWNTVSNPDAAGLVIVERV